MKKIWHYWIKIFVVITLGTVYSLWLWHDADIECTLLISNILAVISMLFLLLGLAGVLHNIHALAAFSYSLRYVTHLFRNFKDKDELTDERMISYADYIQKYRSWKTVPILFLCFFLFLSSSLLVWFLF